MSRVLVVDDMENIRVAFRDILEGDGHEVHTAADAAEGFALLNEREFDVAVIDIILERGSGMDLFSAIRKKSIDVELIIVTANPTIETSSLAFLDGAFDYLVKPIAAQTLIEAVGKATERKGRREDK